MFVNRDTDKHFFMRKNNCKKIGGENIYKRLENKINKAIDPLSNKLYPLLQKDSKFYCLNL